MTNQELLASAIAIGAAVLLALVLHLLAVQVLRRIVRGRPMQHLVERAAAPTRLVAAAIAVLIALPTTDLQPATVGRLDHALVIVLIAAVAWLLLRMIGVAEDAAMRRFTIEQRDNLEARRKRTQAQILTRIGSAVVVLLAAAAVMLTFEEARAVGASLLASAGVAGIVAGIAARSTLGNVIAGLQIAFTEPIRIDDVVVVEGEWGRIEEITLTYVVVRIWDLRRLVLPTTYFVEQPFENWTRTHAQVLGSVTLFVDYTTPVDAVREEFQRILARSEKWDGDVWVLQVIDATEQTMELRALMSAPDAPTSWDLRCEVREGLIAYLQAEQPAALPRLRLTETSGAYAAAGDGRPRGRGQDFAPLEDRRQDG